MNLQFDKTGKEGDGPGETEGYNWFHAPHWKSALKYVKELWPDVQRTHWFKAAVLFNISLEGFMICLGAGIDAEDEPKQPRIGAVGFDMEAEWAQGVPVKTWYKGVAPSIVPAILNMGFEGRCDVNDRARMTKWQRDKVKKRKGKNYTGNEAIPEMVGIVYTTDLKNCAAGYPVGSWDNDRKVWVGETPFDDRTLPMIAVLEGVVPEFDENGLSTLRWNKRDGNNSQQAYEPKHLLVQKLWFYFRP